MARKNKTCEKRIEEELQERIKDFREALNGDFGDTEAEDFIDWINSYALAYVDDNHYRAKRLELSCGGPQDYFLFFEDGTIEYHFLDWFDGAKRVLSENTEDYKIMEEVKEILEI